MARFFFHAADGAPVHDTNGEELPDEGAARAQALHYAGELLRWSPELLSERNQLRVSVTGPDQALLFTVVTVVVDVPPLQRGLHGASAND